MPSQTDAEYYAAAEYHDPHSVLNNLIHAACHRIEMENTLLQVNTHLALEGSKILIKNTHVSYLNFQKLHRVSFKKLKELKKSVGRKFFQMHLN